MTDASPASGAGVTPAPTLGWDLVYAVRIPDVNTRIAEQNVSPPSFSATFGAIPVTGRFGTWSIAQGGADYLVYLTLPIESGTLSQPGAQPIAFTGKATVAVELCYLPGTAGNAAAPTQALQIKQPAGTGATAVGAQAQAGGAQSELFAIQSLTLSTDPDMVVNAFVKAALQQWLYDNSGVFNHVFAVVSLQQAVAGTPYAWLRPTALSYAYADAAAPKDCFLAVLAMTQGRSSANLAEQVTAAAVPAGSDAALLISPYLLLDCIIRNALPSAFAGTTASDFQLATDRPALVLANACQLAPVTIDGSSYTPTLQSFSVEFDANQLVCSSQTSIPVSDGVTAFTSTASVQGLSVTTNAAGQQTLTFVDLSPPQENHWTTTDPAVDQQDQDIGTAIAVGGFVLALFTGGIAGVIIALTSTLLSGLIANLPTLEAGWDTEEAPSLDLLAINATAPVAWTGGTAFAVDTVDLAESLRLSGTPWPSTGTGASS